MYGIFNKEGERLIQFGLHRSEDSAQSACRKALEKYPQSGACIKSVEQCTESSIYWKSRLTGYLMSYGEIKTNNGKRRIIVNTDIRINSITTVESISVDELGKLRYRYRIDGYKPKYKTIDSQMARTLYEALTK